MGNSVLDALSGEHPLIANALGAVTAHWVILRPVPGQAEIVISLSRVSTIKKIKTTYPGLLVVATGSMLVAAAAASSKQGAGASLPIACVGFLFALGYVLARKACVSFKVDGETVQTPEGSLRDAAELMAALEKAIARVDQLEN